MTSKTKSKVRSAAKVDAYQVVTDRICEALEAGYVPWHKPWRDLTDGPRSLSSRKPYRGINVWVLTATAFANGYTSRWWGTYEQMKGRGGQVRKGEKATTIVFWRIIEKKDATGKVIDRIFLLRDFKVFNVDQCDGEMKLPTVDETALADHEPIEVCDAIVERFLADGGPRLDHAGDRAFYSPGADRVQMPLVGAFESIERYYGTLFHELVHATGAEKRLNRKTLTDAKSFGDESYSAEELVAEMGAAFLCGESGIDVPVVQHAAYIASWLRKFRDDPKLLVQAAGGAQRAADLILDRKFESSNDEEKED